MFLEDSMFVLYFSGSIEIEIIHMLYCVANF